MRFLNYGGAIALPFAILVFSACSSSPPPPEINLLENIDFELHKIDAVKYAPDEYNKFKVNLRVLKDKIVQEESKFSIFRNYESIQKNIRDIIADGKKLLIDINEDKSKRKEIISDKIKKLEDKARIINELTLKVNVGASTRKLLTKGDIAIREAKASIDIERYDSTMEKVESATALLNEAEKLVIPTLKRYSQNDIINKWRKSVRDAIEESKRKKMAAIVVDKAERTLTLYKTGKILQVFNIGFGRYGYRDKLFSGDDATPEGRYKIIKKSGKGESKYYKALLLDYPNQEDRKEFLKAKKRGLISKNARIGGLIEIHGGGEDSTTNGCIALENSHMDELFDKVAIGTPVTIVGATSIENELYFGLKELEGNSNLIKR